MCINIVEIWFEIANGQILSVFTELSVCDTLIFFCFQFPGNNLSKYQWISTKLGVCIDIVEIWFRITNGKISSIFESYLPTTYSFVSGR